MENNTHHPITELTNIDPPERKHLQYGDMIGCLLTLATEQVWMQAGEVRDVSLDGTIVVYERDAGNIGWLTPHDWCARWPE